MTDGSRLRAVFDTNVVIAALMSPNPNSPTAELLSRWRAREFTLIYSPALRAEYVDTLTYDPHITTLGEAHTGIQIVDGLHFLYQVRGDTPLSE